VELAAMPETGMGYQVVSIVLEDGSRYDQAVVIEGQVTELRGSETLPFRSEQIAKVILTHEKWNFNAERRNAK
jgi:hypothetical protein